MCGIVGYLGDKLAYPILIDGLKRLEYRGYDSAGIAVFDGSSKIIAVKAVGKVAILEKKLNGFKNQSSIGIAHTRWATHGKPSELNAHPHCDCDGVIYVVHNGIIENYEKLKDALAERGHKFRSQTDTEVIAHLIEDSLEFHEFEDAVIEALGKIKGTYGLVIIHRDFPNKMVVARKGSPLIIGEIENGERGFIVASDGTPIISHTREGVFLQEGQIAFLNRGQAPRYTDLEKSRIISQKSTHMDWSIEVIRKDGFDHFMLKEIHEQPTSVGHAIAGRLTNFLEEKSNPVIGGLRNVEEELRLINRVIIACCGTSYYSALIGEYMLEEFAGIPVEVEYASEYRYRSPIVHPDTALIAISQSGETADTLEALREAKNKSALSLGIVNVIESTIAREVKAGIYCLAGPEIAVASTKAFTSQLAILALITLMLGRQRNMSVAKAKEIAKELEKIPGKIREILDNKEEIKSIAEKYYGFKDWLFLGRKYNYPVALEGALKLKEISYVHAEGYPAGEMKHGPISLICSDFPSMFIVPQDSVYDKVISGMQEIKARDGRIIAIATRGDKKIARHADEVIYIPRTLEMLTPMLSVIPLQLFAYYVAVARGCDVDQPRNLAKSVTVE